MNNNKAIQKSEADEGSLDLLTLQLGGTAKEISFQLERVSDENIEKLIEAIAILLSTSQGGKMARNGTKWHEMARNGMK